MHRPALMSISLIVLLQEAISFLRQAFPSLNLYGANRIGLFVSSNWPPDATPMPYVPEVRPWWAIPSMESQLAPVMVPVADHVWAQFQADPPARIHAAILRDPAYARFREWQQRQISHPQHHTRHRWCDWTCGLTSRTSVQCAHTHDRRGHADRSRLVTLDPGRHRHSRLYVVIPTDVVQVARHSGYQVVVVSSCRGEAAGA